MINPEAILFDLDGTLLDSLPGIQYSAQEAVWSLWPGRQLPDLRPFIGPPIGEMLRCAIPDASPAQIHQLVGGFRESYDAAGWGRTTLFSGSAEVLAALCDLGIRCFVASNKPSFATGRILESLAIRSRFTGIYCRDSRVLAYTSKVEMVGCLLREFGAAADGTWLVGDCSDDLEAAHCNGLRFILASYGYGAILHASEAHCDGIIARPGDLLQLLRRTGNVTLRPL